MLQNKFYQSPRHSLRPSANIHITHLMKLLSLSTEELQQYVETLVAANPALELVNEIRCPNCNHRLGRDGICYTCASKNKSGDDIIVFTAARNDFTPSRTILDNEDGLPADESLMFQEQVELKDYVYEQILPELAEHEKNIAYHLLCNLGDDGLLNAPVEEVARYHFVSVGEVNAIREKIKHADPPGVGSLTIQEAMLTQLDILYEMDPSQKEMIGLARQVLADGYDLLLHQNSRKLAKLMKLDEEELEEVIHFIAVNLYPYPGQTAWGRFKGNRSKNPEQYHTPDIVVSLGGGPEGSLKIEVLTPFWGTVRVNPLFKEALSTAPDQKLDKWKSDLEDASLLVKCVKNRYQTMILLMKAVSRIQRGYILRGDEYLEPITRASLAREVGVHESTISRAVSGKKIQLPNGKIIPLSNFFDRSLPARTALKKLVQGEPRPLSDRQLALELAKLGFPIKRRTVAKYRIQEGILPARLRKSFAGVAEAA